MKEDNHDLEKVDVPLNNSGGVHGCLISSIGILFFAVGIGLIILSAKIENILVALIGLLLCTVIAGFLFLYPLIRFFFGGKDSVAAAITTVIVEGVVTQKIMKHSRKRRNRR